MLHDPHIRFHVLAVQLEGGLLQNEGLGYTFLAGLQEEARARSAVVEIA